MNKDMPLSQWSDEELVAAFCKNRDTRKRYFGVLYSRYKDKLFSKVCQVTQDYDNAEDITQDIFLKLYFSLPRFRGKSQFTTWCYRICMNHCFDLLRQRQRTPDPLELNEDVMGEQHSDESPFLQMIEKAEKGAVEQALAKMKPQERSMLLLKYQDELTAAEIGGIYGADENTIRQRIFRAKKAFMAYYVPLSQSFKTMLVSLLTPWLS